jgi:hypothetical protein
MSSSRTDRDLPFVTGAVAGTGAWVLNYLFVYVITSGDIRNSVLGQFTEIPTWKIVGWVFYNAHYVDTIYDVPIFGGAGNAIGGEDGFTVLLFVVVPVVLLIAGLAVGRYAGVDDLDATNAALAGATLVPGYALLSVVGVFAFASERVTPDVVTGILLAGLLYPLVFGALGTLAARATTGR